MVGLTVTRLKNGFVWYCYPPRTQHLRTRSSSCWIIIPLICRLRQFNLLTVITFVCFPSFETLLISCNRWTSPYLVFSKNWFSRSGVLTLRIRIRIQVQVRVLPVCLQLPTHVTTPTSHRLIELTCC